MRMVSLLSEDTLRAEVAEAHDVLEQCSGAATPWGVTSRLAGTLVPVQSHGAEASRFRVPFLATAGVP